MSALSVVQLGTIHPYEVAGRSRAQLDRPLKGDAQLTLAILGAEAVLLGAFQRTSELTAPHPRLVLRRISGGTAARVGPGSVWLSLALARIDALVPCETSKIVSRHVRPLLRALTRLGRPAQHSGQDWITVAHRPAATVGFAHDATSGRAVFEAVVALSTPFVASRRAAFLGKPPATLDQLHGKRIDPVALCGSIAEAYAEEHLLTIEPIAVGDVPPAEGAAPHDEPAWAATIEEGFARVSAGRDGDGRMRVGGELLVSRDALAALEARIETLGPFAARAEVAHVVDATLGRPNVAVDGVRALGSIAGVVLKAIDAGR